MNHEDEHINHENNTENYSDPGRYESAAGWQPKQPKDKWAKLLDDYRKNHLEEFCRDSMFETKPAGEYMRSDTANKPPTDLFGALWRTGELALLAGESGMGK